MNRFPNSSVEIDENELYYFLTLQNDRFNTGFVGWLTEDLVYALTEYFTTGDPTAAYYQIKMNIGKNRFLIDSNQNAKPYSFLFWYYFLHLNKS